MLLTLYGCYIMDVLITQVTWVALRVPVKKIFINISWNNTFHGFTQRFFSCNFTHDTVGKQQCELIMSYQIGADIRRPWFEHFWCWCPCVHLVCVWFPPVSCKLRFSLHLFLFFASWRWLYKAAVQLIKLRRTVFSVSTFCWAQVAF